MALCRGERSRLSDAGLKSYKGGYCGKAIVTRVHDIVSSWELWAVVTDGIDVTELLHYDGGYDDI